MQRQILLPLCRCGALDMHEQMRRRCRNRNSFVNGCKCPLDDESLVLVVVRFGVVSGDDMEFVVRSLLTLDCGRVADVLWSCSKSKVRANKQSIARRMRARMQLGVYRVRNVSASLPHGTSQMWRDYGQSA